MQGLQLLDRFDHNSTESLSMVRSQLAHIQTLSEKSNYWTLIQLLYDRSDDNLNGSQATYMVRRPITLGPAPIISSQIQFSQISSVSFGILILTDIFHFQSDFLFTEIHFHSEFSLSLLEKISKIGQFSNQA